MKNLEDQFQDFLYSIVIPVYNSESIITDTINELLLVINCNNINAEIVLVNDGGTDGSWKIIKMLAFQYHIVKAIKLVKNYGQHSALLCGFKHSRGDFIITMDDDLQNPPTEIIKLIKKVHQGNYDVVFGEFRAKKHSLYRKVGSKLIGYLNHKIFNKPKDLVLSNFRIINKRVVDRIITYKTAYPYIPGLILLFASSSGNVLVEHHQRLVGRSNYSMKKIISLVSRLLINYSSYPLRLLSTIGLIVSLTSFFIGVYYLGRNLLYGTNVQGWTTLVVLTSFLGGFIIALLGIMGEYLSRILDQMSTDKSYYIKEIVDE